MMTRRGELMMANSGKTDVPKRRASVKQRGNVKRSRNKRTRGRERMANSSESSTPRQKLRALRKRAGLSGKDCARLLGLAGGTSYMRYENDTRYDNLKYQFRIIQPLMEAFVGKGIPAITEDDMLEIADIGELSSAVSAVERDRIKRTSSNVESRPDVRAQVQTDRDILIQVFGVLKLMDETDRNVSVLKQMIQEHIWQQTPSSD